MRNKKFNLLAKSVFVAIVMFTLATLAGCNNNSNSSDGLPDEFTFSAELLKLAEDGNVDAQYCLGGCYYYGKGIAKDIDEAIMWWSKAAEQGDEGAIEMLKQLGASGYSAELVEKAEGGDVNAQYNLAHCYWLGDGVAQDVEEAVKWLRKGAEQGHAESQQQLGHCYYDGKGVTQDYTEAVKWWSKAAEQGNGNAQFNLGSSYRDGVGVAKDLDEAEKWFSKAADQEVMNAYQCMKDVQELKKEEKK